MIIIPPTQISAQAEHWKSVGTYNGIDYNGLYTVSDMGAVYSVTRDCAVLGTRDNKGRVWVNLFKAGHVVSYLLDRLVLITFDGPPPHRHARVVHENRIPSDCRLSNLSWAVSESGTPFSLAMHLLTRGATRAPYWMLHDVLQAQPRSGLQRRMGGVR